jgi:putative flippase GtrA
MLRLATFAHHWRQRLAMWIRYATVSLISTITGLSVLAVLVAGAQMPAGWANVIATAVGTVPSFELNRRWVWEKRGRRSPLAEVLPFCALCLVELLLSTLAVHEAAAWADRLDWSPLVRTAVVMMANVGTFAVLWVGQYVILDRVLFRSRRRGVLPANLPQPPTTGEPRVTVKRVPESLTLRRVSG